jgi:hypothetical protein
MNFMPKVPGAMPVSYGEGYGDWQQYAGFNKNNPFGSLPDLQPVAPSASTPEPYKPDVEMPKMDYAIKPPTSPYGAFSTGFSTPSISTQFPSLADQARKHFGE